MQHRIQLPCPAVPISSESLPLVTPRERGESEKMKARLRDESTASGVGSKKTSKVSMTYSSNSSNWSGADVVGCATTSTASPNAESTTNDVKLVNADIVLSLLFCTAANFDHV